LGVSGGLEGARVDGGVKKHYTQEKTFGGRYKGNEIAEKPEEIGPERGGNLRSKKDAVSRIRKKDQWA